MPMEIHFNRSDLIGKGAFATVFKGSYRGRLVAIKRIGLSQQPKDVMSREETALKLLNGHPNIVEFLHAENDDDFW